MSQGNIGGQSVSRIPMAGVQGSGVRPGQSANRPLTGAGPQACVNHSAVKTNVRCDRCGAPVCATCAFKFPDGHQFCPACATDSKVRLSPIRRAMSWSSVGLGILAALATVCFFLLALMIANHAVNLILGGLMVIVLGVLAVPASLIGLGVALGALDKKRGNSVLVLSAVTLNAIILGLWLMLIILPRLL